MVKFHCNLPDTMIRGMRFQEGYYETEDLEEIEFLCSYGAQQGCVVTLVNEDAPVQEYIQKDVSEENSKRGRPRNKQ